MHVYLIFLGLSLQLPIFTFDVCLSFQIVKWLRQSQNVPLDFCVWTNIHTVDLQQFHCSFTSFICLVFVSRTILYANFLFDCVIIRLLMLLLLLFLLLVLLFLLLLLPLLLALQQLRYRCCCYYYCCFNDVWRVCCTRRSDNNISMLANVSVICTLHTSLAHSYTYSVSHSLLYMCTIVCT